MDIYSQIANLGTQFQPVTSAIQGYSSGLQLQEMMRRRDAMQQQQAQQSRLQELLSRASAGDTGAYQQALAIDPQQATMFAEGISRQQASQSAASRARSEQVAKAMLTVESAPDVMKPAAYQQLRQRLAQTYPDIASKMPEQYDQIWVRGTIDQAMSIEQLTGRGPEYQIGDVVIGGRQQKAYIPKRPGGEVVPIGEPSPEKEKTKDKTESQRKAAGFAERMSSAESTLTGLEQSGFDPASWKENTLASLPGGNYLVSEDFQKYKQAAENWITAVLRKESGAQITQDEMDIAYRNYFPQKGDSQAVIEQKRRNRELVARTMFEEAGKEPANKDISTNSARLRYNPQTGVFE